MAITENKVPTEILVRFAEDGSIAGSHVAFLETLMRDGVEISRKIDGPHPLGSVVFPTEVILDQALTAALATINSLNAEKAEIENQLKERPAAAAQELSAGEVTMRQARLALHIRGILPAVQPAIDQLPEPDRTAAQIEWEYSQTVERDRHFVITLCQLLGINDEQRYELFAFAATL